MKNWKKLTAAALAALALVGALAGCGNNADKRQILSRQQK